MWAFLTERQFRQGKTREVPRIALEATPDGWRLTVTDYNLSVKVVVVVKYLEQLWSELEKKFDVNATGWAETKTGEGAKRRKAEEERRLATQQDEMYTLSKGGGDPKAKRKE